MALRVWLPLNGNLENKGLSEITTTNTPVFLNNGKLGQCISLASQVNFSNMPRMDKFTILFWLRVDSCSVNWADSLGITSVQADGSSASQFRFEATVDSRACSFHNNTPYAITTGSRILITEEQKGEWHHCGFSYDGTTCYTYIDGVRTYSDSGLGGYIINHFHIGETGNIAGGMNDLRIYDNVLSDKEIREISKGLVAHYKLEPSNINANLAVENPLVASGASALSFNSATQTYTITSPVGDSTWGYGVNIGTNPKCIVPYNSFYRFSFEVWVPSTHEICVDYNNYANTGDSWNGNDNDLTSARISNIVSIPGGIWTKCVFGSQNAHASNVNQIPIYEVSKIGLRTESDTASVVWYLRNFKFELSNQATDYVPYGYNPLELLATDVSGNGYNGTITGTLSYYNNSPRYQSSTYFNGSSYITTNSGSMAWFDFNNLTLSAWINPTVTPSAWTGSIGVQMDNSYTTGRLFSISNYGGKFSVHTDTNSGWVTTQSETLPLNTWSHCVATLENGVNLKMYINGVLVKTATLDWGTNSTLTANDTRFAIGVDLPGDDEKYTGYYSDVRLYTTTLSAADIKNLYEVSAIIDDKQYMHAYEFQTTMENLAAPASNNIILKQMGNGLASYTQANCQCTLTDDGFRVYRTPNIDSSAHNMWGGLQFSPNFAGDVLQKGHKYIMFYDVKGRTNNAQTSIGWTNQMGWGGGGLSPEPSNVEETHIPANFNSDDWQTFYYKWDLDDDVRKTCTSSYSGFVEGNVYVSYRDFMVGWGYETTGDVGTDIYINNLRLYDITDINNPKIFKTGIASFDNIKETDDIVKIKEIESEAFDLIEI